MQSRSNPIEMIGIRALDAKPHKSPEKRRPRFTLCEIFRCREVRHLARGAARKRGARRTVEKKGAKPACKPGSVHGANAA